MSKTGWKTTIVILAVLLCVSQAFAQPGRPGGAPRGRGPAQVVNPPPVDEPMDAPLWLRDGPGWGAGPGMGMRRGMGLGMGMGRGMGPGMGPGMATRPHAGLMLLGALRRLDLTDEQIEAIKAIVEEGKEQMQDAGQAVAEATKALHEAVAAVAQGKGEAQAIHDAAAALGNAMAAQAALQAEKHAAILAVLTDEQRQKLEQMKAKAEELRQKMEELRELGGLGLGRGAGRGFGGVCPWGIGPGWQGPDVPPPAQEPLVGPRPRGTPEQRDAIRDRLRDRGSR